MRYQYRKEAIASKPCDAKQISGLPKDIALDFNRVHIRVYRSEEQPGFFSCSLAIPAHQDDEGYVLEMEFLDPIALSELDRPEVEADPRLESEFDFGQPSRWLYESPFNEHGLDTLIQAMSCNFCDEVEEGRRNLILNLRIQGTPFNGCLAIYPELYDVTS